MILEDSIEAQTPQETKDMTLTSHSEFHQSTLVLLLGQSCINTYLGQAGLASLR